VADRAADHEQQRVTVQPPRITRPSLRSAHPADAGACAELLAQLGYPAESGVIARRLTTLLGRDDYRVAVAERDGELAGVGAVHVFHAIHSDRPLAFIAALVVRESRRGGGIGSRLVAELEAFAAEHGCDRIIVTTANHREGAHRFYERLGYELTGRRYAKRMP
jgi:GNAT superfamily N-acetyltransferase